MKINHKLSIGILCLLIMAFGILTLTACGRKECSHDWSDWTITESASCTDDGSKERTCTSCGKIDTAAVPAAHTGDSVLVKHIDTHYNAYSCCFEKISAPAAHTIINGVCTECGFDPTVTIGSIEASEGQTHIEIAVSVNDNPGITGLTAKIKYSSDIFTLTEARCGDAFKNLAFTSPSKLDSGCTFLWDAVSTDDKDIKNGEFLILVFDIAENAPAGEYSILFDINAYDNELNPITLRIDGGKVTINN